MTLLFLIWSIIQNFVVENKPNADGDNNVLYDVLTWKNDPKFAAIVAVIVLLVGSLSLSTIVWGISLCSHRYVEPEGEEQRRKWNVTRRLKCKNHLKCKKRRRQGCTDPLINVYHEFYKQSPRDLSHAKRGASLRKRKVLEKCKEIMKIAI
jgi:hypothetical protein